MLGHQREKRKRHRYALTRCSFRPLVHHDLVPPDALAEGFVTDRQSYNSQKGEDEGGIRGDVPLAEDDAEVVGVPGEEHLVTEYDK